MIVRKLTLLILNVLLIVGCSSMHATKRFEPDYLDFICGSWSEKAVISSPDGKQLGEASATWECRYDAEQECYLLTGEVRFAEEDPIQRTSEYRRISNTEASTMNEVNGRKSHGFLKQTSASRIEKTGYDDDGHLVMRQTSTFADDDTITSDATYYDSAGRVTMTVHVVDVRQDP